MLVSIQDTIAQEIMQSRSTKMLLGVECFSYTKRLDRIGLFFLKQRGLMGNQNYEGCG